MRKLSCAENLKKLTLEPLELIRTKCDLVFVFKLIYGLVDADLKKIFPMIEPSNPTKTNGKNYRKRLKKTFK